MKNKYTGIITKNFISRKISKEMSKEISKEISREISREISTGCILVSDWNEIMKSCDNYFKYRYNVFRSSFWGENAGIPLRSNPRKIPSYKSLVKIYNEKSKFHYDLLLDDSFISRLKDFKSVSYMDPGLGFMWDKVLR